MTSIDRVARPPEMIHRRGGVRRAALLDAARELFLAGGYEGTQMQDVAFRAGASKETLYRHFPAKADLFMAVVRTIADELGTASIGPSGSGSARAALEAFGESFLNGVLKPEAIALHRLAIAEAARFPDLGRIFDEAGPAMVKERLANYLETATAEGVFRCPAPAHAAALLLGTLISDLQLRALLGRGPLPQDRRRHVAEAVAMFMARYERA